MDSPCLERFSFVSAFKGAEEEDLDHVSKRLDLDTDKEVVIKKLSPNYLKEYEANTRLKHENIAKLLDCSLNTHKFFVFEMVGDMDMFDWCQDYHEKHEYTNVPEQTESIVLKFAKQIREALEYCHSQKIAHRDIKLENIRVDTRESKVYLIDFDMAYISKVTKDRKFRCGTVEYAAPELLGYTQHPISPYKMDVWCFGVTLFAMAHNALPYVAHPRRFSTQVDRVDAVYSFEFSTIVERMLSIDPFKRPSTRRLKKKAWFKNS